MVFYKCDICGRAVQHPQILPAVIMATICQAVSELQEAAEGAQCLS